MILLISTIFTISFIILAMIGAANYFANNNARCLFWIAIICLALTCIIGFGCLGNQQEGEPEITYVHPDDLAIGEKHVFAKLDTVLVKDRTYESNIYADVMAAKEKKQIMMRVDTRKNSYGNVILEIVDFVATNMLPVTNTVPELILEKK